MAAAAPIVVTTVAPLVATPANVLSFAINTATGPNDGTMDPAGRDANGVVRWEDRRSGIARAMPYLTFGFRKPTSGGLGVSKATIRLVVPVMEEVSYDTNGVKPGANVAYTNEAALSLMMHDRSTAADKALFASYFYSVLASRLLRSDLTTPVNTNSPIGGFLLNPQAVW